MNAALVLVQRFGSDALVKLISIGNPGSEGLIELVERLRHRRGAETQANFLAPARWNIQGVMCRRLRSCLGWIHRLVLACDHALMKRVLHVRRRIRLLPQ